MPSPVGHALAGLAIAWTAQAIANEPSIDDQGGGLATLSRRAFWGLPALCALSAVAPDLDILLGSHRTLTHSLGGVVAAGVLMAGLAWLAGRSVGWGVAACTLAFASHIALDWLGHDTSVPVGIPALWPLTQQYYYSGLDLFWDVSRRYWLPHEFIGGNLRVVGHELMILLPVATAALCLRLRPRPTTRAPEA